MGYEQQLIRLISFDNIAFSIEISALIIYIYILKNNLFLKAVLFLYGIITLSNYNIFVRVIHDFNIPIFRTFLNKFQIFEKINLMDIFMVSIFILILPAKNTLKKIFEYLKEFNYIFLITSLILIISLFSLFLNNEYINIDLRLQLTQYRGFIYTFVLIVIFYLASLKISSKEQALNFLQMMVILDLINVLGEIVSGIIFSEYVWSRGGKQVLMIDQANSMLALCYLSVFAAKSRFSTVLFKISGLLIIGIVLYDFNKYMYIVIPIYIIVINFDKITSLRKLYKILLSIIAIASMLFMVGKLIQDKSIKDTRYIQLTSYVDSIDNDFYAILLGSGIGGKYIVSDVAKQDHGSIKSEERAQRVGSRYQSEFQIPFLWYFKSCGLIGIMLAIIMITFMINVSYRLRFRNIDAASYAIIIAIMIIPDNPLMSPDSNSIIYFVRVFFLFYLSKKYFNI